MDAGKECSYTGRHGKKFGESDANTPGGEREHAERLAKQYAEQMGHILPFLNDPDLAQSDPSVAERALLKVADFLQEVVGGMADKVAQCKQRSKHPSCVELEKADMVAHGEEGGEDEGEGDGGARVGGQGGAGAHKDKFCHVRKLNRLSDEQFTAEQGLNTVVQFQAAVKAGDTPVMSLILMVPRALRAHFDSVRHPADKVVAFLIRDIQTGTSCTVARWLMVSSTTQSVMELLLNIIRQGLARIPGGDRVCFTSADGGNAKALWCSTKQPSTPFACRKRAVQNVRSANSKISAGGEGGGEQGEEGPEGGPRNKRAKLEQLMLRSIERRPKGWFRKVEPTLGPGGVPPPPHPWEERIGGAVASLMGCEVEEGGGDVGNAAAQKPLCGVVVLMCSSIRKNSVECDALAEQVAALGGVVRKAFGPSVTLFMFDHDDEEKLSISDKSTLNKVRDQGLHVSLVSTSFVDACRRDDTRKPDVEDHTPSAIANGSHAKNSVDSTQWEKGEDVPYKKGHAGDVFRAWMSRLTRQSKLPLKMLGTEPDLGDLEDLNEIVVTLAEARESYKLHKRENYFSVSTGGNGFSVWEPKGALNPESMFDDAVDDDGDVSGDAYKKVMRDVRGCKEFPEPRAPTGSRTLSTIPEGTSCFITGAQLEAARAMNEEECSMKQLKAAALDTEMKTVMKCAEDSSAEALLRAGYHVAVVEQVTSFGKNEWIPQPEVCTSCTPFPRTTFRRTSRARIAYHGRF